MPQGTPTSIVAGDDHEAPPTTRKWTPAAVRDGSRAARRSESGSEGVVFLIDVDNTLLDNDRFNSDLSNRLELEFGIQGRDRYWGIYEALRSELGYSDYLGALQRFRVIDDGDPRLPPMSSYLLDYPFADRLYPGALPALAHLARLGVAVIVSDGDVVFQPRKIHRSGLWEAVAGRVLIYVHKENMLEDITGRYPARHYVMIDDKARVLAAMKKILGDRLTTVLPQQGHYALDPRNIASYPAPDVTVAQIGDLVHHDLTVLRGVVPEVQSGKETS